jgi:TetR/AcrR family transcriptional regulator, repressor of fatR-cypB operon
MSGPGQQLTPRLAGALATRDALLDAALAAFTEHTYAGTAVPSVAERAGVAVGTIYRHFPSKQALGNAVYQHWKGQLLARLSAGPEGGSARHAFTHLWTTLDRFASEHPDAFAFLEYQQHASYLDADSIALNERSTALARDMVVQGQKSGEIRDGDPTVLVALAYGAFIGLSKARWSGAIHGTPDVAAAESAVWDLLRA